ncbi:ADP-ribosylglycohydrolase family protein [Pseudoalteromonas luteoviolacea]|uniref:ADP-ribosylglycohydrolase family protein n=1 Tax=Pseudoalteromonas luteoviolacea TaxID=43657 RepID=UPI001B373982|nr:ADP-ribosylglycohydrolase family protein [Pseudoalteromonas luteoviolacea]
MIEKSKFIGCFKAVAIGDASGAIYEGGPLERAAWWLLGVTSDGKKRYTDDTQMSIDVAKSFIANQGIDQAHLASEFAQSYHWTRGYGPSAAKLLKGIQSGKDYKTLNKAKFKDGSKGNGAAMRASVVAMCNLIGKGNLIDDIIKVSEITHAHPEAIEGAFLIARATQLAMRGVERIGVVQTLCNESKVPIYQSKLATCYRALISDSVLTQTELKLLLGNGMLSADSVVTALYFAFKYRHEPLSKMITNICALGGDTDTICAMAGGIWGAYNGDNGLDEYDQKIEGLEEVSSLALQIYDLYSVSKQGAF